MMPRRKPVGCVFWPMARLLLVRDHHRQVAGLVVDAVAAAHRARHVAPVDRAAVDRDRVDPQLVDRRVAAGAVLGVRRRGLDRLGDDARGLLRHEVEQAHGLLHPLAADEVRDHPHLAGRHRDAADECACLHGYFFRSPLWPWYVRVGENSPSLWPTCCSVTNTGMNLRPLWTAMVSPTMEGVIVERRENVETTRLFGFDSFEAAA